MAEKLSQLLEPIAAWFRSLGVPEAVVHWGHPAMMNDGDCNFCGGDFCGGDGLARKVAGAEG